MDEKSPKSDREAIYLHYRAFFNKNKQRNMQIVLKTITKITSKHAISGRVGLYSKQCNPISDIGLGLTCFGPKIIKY